ncbi:MAG TPA: TspO/MBR family protein [Burkholderiaceae bacterium]
MTRQHRKRQWLALAGFLALAFLCAGIGALATSNAREFYAALVKPEWAPPGSVFAPVWTTLFFLMGVAAWLVWRARGWNGALTLFCAQLVANALWSWLFFAWQRGALAFVEVLVLWAMIAATLLAFWRIRPLAGALLVPNLAWVTFASALTWATWQRNPALLG